MTDEGQRAIEAAADAMPWEDEGVADYQAAARKVVRAYLEALSGWRLVRTKYVEPQKLPLETPPGLESDT